MFNEQHYSEFHTGPCIIHRPDELRDVVTNHFLASDTIDKFLVDGHHIAAILSLEGHELSQ